MELARTLKTLWIRRRLVALGAVIAAIAALLSVYSVSLFPPSLTSRTNVFATASTQLLVDTPDSAFADLANDLTPLETRASVFARFLASPAALELISREADVPLSSIEAQGPYDINLPVIQQEPTAGQRSSQIIGEGALYRLRFENNPVLPIVSIFAQAPSKAEAVALANAAPRALRAYINRIQAEQETPADRRVVIRKLGDAEGGVVNEGANLQIALLVFIVVLGGWCMLLIPAQTLARGWREADIYGDDPNGPTAGPHEYGPQGGYGYPGEHEQVR
jgi:capsular polysaccharide biosynthesis protein